MTIKQVLKKATEKLKIEKIKTARLDAALLLSHVLKKSREYLITHPEEKLEKSLVTGCWLLVTKRAANGTPLAHLIGRKEFFGLDFEVSKHTLIPRPETELLVEEAIKISQKSKIKSQKYIAVDIGTGSGCIIVSLAKELEKKNLIKNTQLFATDISKNALETAQKNAKKHKVDKKITFLQGDLLEPFSRNSQFVIRNSNFLIIANLPYLSQEIYESCPKSVKEFEPKNALFSPKKGLSHYVELLKQIKILIKKEKQIETCTAILEISPEQKDLVNEEIKKIFPQAKITFKKDLAQKWRMVKIKII